ncbi:MAG: glycosyltransferase [Deltaproteobacteria bacterium]|nr:glycosyltransferase [Deltaproteobacteria bacterium]
MKFSFSVLVMGDSAIKNVITEFGEPKRIFVSPFGSYREFYPNQISRKNARNNLGLSPSNRLFLFFGTAHSNRNPVELIQAFRSFSNPNIRLIVAATWYAEKTRREILEAVKNDDRITTQFDLIPPEKAEVLFKAADFVALPSHYYLTSGVIVTSLSFGCPVIAEEYGCAPSQIRDAGFIYDSKDEDGLMNALQQAVECDVDEYKRRAQRISEALSWNLCAQKIAEAYRS